MRARFALNVCLLLLIADNPSARAGREIWFFATAFNDRFFTYSYPQRLGAAIDWYKILAAKNKRDLFPGWGITPDPDCCIPGDPNCPKRSLEETYGFQYCKGDDDLLKFVGKDGYRDPACDFKDSAFDPTTHAQLLNFNSYDPNFTAGVRVPASVASTEVTKLIRNQLRTRGPRQEASK